MKIGDIIFCGYEEYMKQMLVDLSCMGFHAVRNSDVGYDLRITDVPEPEYRVQAWDENGRHQTYCCSNLEEAKACFSEMCGLYDNTVELLKGYPGEWEIVQTS